MGGPVIESYPIKRVAFGSLNGRPHQVFELPVDEEATKLRYAHRYTPREGGPSNTVVRSFSRLGLVDEDYLARVDGSESMPIIVVPRAQARKVKQYDMMVVPTDGASDTCIVFAKEELLADKSTRGRLGDLARELYLLLRTNSVNGHQQL